MLPNLFIVGAPRCGTTFLWHCLRQHPRVFMSPIKEPLYFAAHPNTVWRGPGDCQPLVSREKYLALFADARPAMHRFAGDASTLYLSAPDAPERVRNMSPDAKIVCVLRNPIGRAWSHFVQHRSQARETCGRFVDAVAMENRRLHDGWAPFWGYTELSKYSAQIERWRACFSASQFGVFLFDDLAADATAFVCQVLKFLDLEPLPGGPVSKMARNEAHLPRSLLLAQAVSDADNRFFVVGRALVPRHWRTYLRWLLQTMNRRSPSTELTSAERLELAHLFDGDVRHIERLLHRDLEAWRK